MKAARYLLWALLLCLILAVPALAEDTGTYEIVDYTVKLTPHSDGKVDIDYHQKWLVTGGHIPWITVGVPNSDYRITGSSGAVKTISDASQGGWYGVRIDLDKDYRANQSFEVNFSISQSKLFYADKENYKLDFTPGWYDRARTDRLEIRLVSFAKPETVTADPAPDSTTEDELVWTRRNLGEGEQFKISVSFPKTVVPNAIAEENLRDDAETEENPSNFDGIIGLVVLLILFGGAVLFIRAILSASMGTRRRRRYTGGNVWWGGFFDSLGGGDSDDDDRHTGGGGGFGGGGFSCACACVSCACACACAGGSGAGCSRKLKHSCPACAERKRRLAQSS